MSTRQVIAAGLILGVTAALVVWWLERFETERMHGEVARYLRDHADFQDWLAARPGRGPEA